MKKLFCILLCLGFAVLSVACTQTEIQDTSSDITSSQQPIIDEQPEKQQKIIEISTAEQLFNLSYNYGTGTDDYENIKYILTNDIDMSGITGFNPIGQERYFTDYSNMNQRGFKSHFDGQGYTIRNLTIDYNGDGDGKNGNRSAGLFGGCG